MADYRSPSRVRDAAAFLAIEHLFAADVVSKADVRIHFGRRTRQLSANATRSTWRFVRRRDVRLRASEFVPVTTSASAED